MKAEIYNALQCAKNYYKCQYNFPEHKAVKAYWEEKESFTWENLCIFSTLTFSGFHLFKFTIALLIHLLETEQYHDKYEEKLKSDLPNLKEYFHKVANNSSIIFEDRYDEIAFIRIQDKSTIALRRISIENSFFRDLFIEFLGTSNYIFSRVHAEAAYLFPLSPDNKNIKNVNDITSETFWSQIQFFQNYYKSNESVKKRAIEDVAFFYRWLITKFNDHDFFAGSSNLSTELLLSNALVKHISSGAYFTTLTKTENLGDKPLICFIIRNLDKYSTRLKKEDHFLLNTENIETSIYRSLVNKYIQNLPSVSGATWCGNINPTTNALHFIEQIKRQPNYPNPSIYHFNTAEAVLIRNFFEKETDHLSMTTFNNRLSATRRFFEWCKNNKQLVFDSTFFDYFSQYEEPNSFQGEPIPDEDLKKIIETFQTTCKESQEILLTYAIFLILLETEFRVSQICNLKVSALQPSMKQDQFFIYSNTKTTNGRQVSQPICLATKKILEKVINETQELRNKAVSAAFSENIFLKIGSNKMITPFTCETFLDSFQKICTKAGVKKYTSQNLRDTHMTKAYNFILKTGKSDLELALLSHHKNISTTKSHYIEIELKKMLEATYKVILDSRDITQQARVLNELPKNLQTAATIVEKGCGHCSSAMCTVQGSTPCLICKSFVTTIAHKPYFIKAIETLDQLIERTTIPHQIEDLNLMKKLYVGWLREIYILEEEENAKRTNC